ncbi:MAG TPA: TerC family protein [Planctomycetota bacterium]|nr:TerC family protein [Planctomycetota bacterium]
MSHTYMLWGLFAVLVTTCLAVDLGLGSRRVGRMPVRTAAVWTAIWVSLAGVFAGLIYLFPPHGWAGRDAAILFVTGFLVEKALSVDNMFVFIMVFSYFAVKDEDQPRVLKWGIIGALLFRGALISAGWVLIARFEWVLYIFALLLLWAVYKMVTAEDEQIEPEKNPVLLLARRVFPIANRYEGHHFFTREGGKLVGTALLVVLIVIESTDVVFALDSIPAIFAITKDFFIVFTSNVFAILGLRALFFVLSGIMGLFRFLKLGVAAILLFIAAKMLLKEVAFVHERITPPVSLAVIGAILVVAVVASVLIKEREDEKKEQAPASPDGTPPSPAPVSDRR